MRLALLAAAAVLSAGSAARADQIAVLRIYGPGGPLTPLAECGKLFAKEKAVQVRVDGGPEQRWLEMARADGDLVFDAAEYMLTDFIRRHPGFLDPATRVSLYDQPAAILVRPGNPKGIRGVQDLARPEVRLLEVVGAGQLGLWEDLAGRKGLIPALRRNIAASFANTAEAIAAWKDRPELDAWITFEGWHHRLPEDTALVRLPEAEQLLRGTPIAVTARSEQRALALAFLEFARSEACHAVFRKQGWR
jgi:accessory colonization factor AcfC